MSRSSERGDPPGAWALASADHGGSPPLSNDALVDMESAVVGSALCDAKLIDGLKLTPADFFDPVLGRLFETIVADRAAGRTIDPILYNHRFEDDLDMREMGGAQRVISKLIADALTAAPLEAYAQKIKSAAGLRRAKCDLDRALGHLRLGNVLGYREGLLQASSRVDLPDAARPGWVLHLPEDINAPLPPIDWTVKGLIAAGELALIYGPSGSGKSFLAIDIAFAVAAGLPWRDRSTKRGSVLYLAAEGGTGVLRRIKAIRTSADSPDNQLFVLEASPRLLDPSDVQALVGLARTCERQSGRTPRLIVIDTLARVAGGADENSSSDMGGLVAALGQLQRETGAAILVVHHTGKDTERGPRGHSSLRAAVDTAIEVSCEGSDGYRSARLVKQKDGEEGTEFGFKLKQVVLGTDADGDPITSCVLEPVETEPPKPTKPKLPVSAKSALKALHNAIIDHGEAAPTNDYIPRHVRVVRIERWREQALREGLAAGQTEAAASRAFLRARDRLNAENQIGIYNDHVWIRADASTTDTTPL